MIDQPVHESAMTYVVATIKPWNIELFEKRFGQDAAWHLISEPASLTLEMLHALAPRCVFFPHWSWIVPQEILDAHECVCFHMTDLPYGRGGSPLQNLIARGHAETKVTALRMTGELDAGPIYMKRPLSLAGSAAEIYRRAAVIVFDMIEEIVRDCPEPTPQEGTPTLFRRRRPQESALPVEGSMEQLYDHIRMLDAPGYPHAFLDHGAFRLEFRNAERNDDSLAATVTIRKRG